MFLRLQQPNGCSSPLDLLLEPFFMQGKLQHLEDGADLTCTNLQVWGSLSLQWAEVLLGASPSWATQMNVPFSSWRPLPLFLQGSHSQLLQLYLYSLQFPFLSLFHLSKCPLRVRQEPNTVLQAWHNQRGENTLAHTCFCCRGPRRIWAASSCC